MWDDVFVTGVRSDTMNQIPNRHGVTKLYCVLLLRASKIRNITMSKDVMCFGQDDCDLKNEALQSCARFHSKSRVSSWIHSVPSLVSFVGTADSSSFKHAVP